jgi:HSP20 family protein
MYSVSGEKSGKHPARKGGRFVGPGQELPAAAKIFRTIKENGMKTLTMYRPTTIQNALSDFDRYFESFFGDSVLAPAARIFNRMPAVDVRETEDSYLMEMELPGYDEKNIDIHVDGASLSITSRQEETCEEKKNDKEDHGAYLLRERRIDSFSRSFKLPENADPESVKASFSSGILKLEIGKRPEAKKRTIQISAG